MRMHDSPELAGEARYPTPTPTPTAAAESAPGAAPDSVPDSVRWLDDGWTLEHAERGISIGVSVPFDVHHALLQAGIIEDPYWRDRECELDWIHRGEWTVHRTVTLGADALHGHWTLSVQRIDCVATVRVGNAAGDRVHDRIAARVDNAFLRHDIDLTGLLVPGENRLQISLHSNSAAAQAAAARFPFELPYVEANCRIPHTNHLRKMACDAGWDWNIALMPLGVLGDVRLLRNAAVRLDELKVVQRHRSGVAHVAISVFAHGFDVARSDPAGSGGVAMSDPATIDLGVSLCERTVSETVRVLPGENRWTVNLALEQPELWWPIGHGAQTLHVLQVRLGEQTLTRTIGLRQVRLLTTPDETGARFALCVNGREMFMRGANWIPADALPARCTPQRIHALIDAAADANMNMLRVWGGGRYECEAFYERCDERGLLVWQDFMFACNHYPAADRQWLASVRQEARQQLRRLSCHPCLALWCGDNEIIGALDWFEVTRTNRDRYLANYVILNHSLDECVQAEAIDVPFWPSSPSSGRLDFGDAWHDDRSGDMHFWDVWHSAREFEHYRSVVPRFCSEFGFQSFPSMPVIERFTTPEDRNVSSPVMEVHQRNEGGNSRIVETISRYFRFPDSFERMVYLSQVAQALAMQTAVEFWRSRKPRTMGTLYWQLNDTWPVASWSSLEHGGGWKLCHYLARRFYAPLLITAQPDADTGETVVYAISDLPGDTPVSYELMLAGLDGGIQALASGTGPVPGDRAIELLRLPRGAIPDAHVLQMFWQTGDGAHESDNTCVPFRYKRHALPDASIDAEWRAGPKGPELVLRTDAPAFYVTLGLGGDVLWTDNGFTLLPGHERVIRPQRAMPGCEAGFDARYITTDLQHLAAGPRTIPAFDVRAVHA